MHSGLHHELANVKILCPTFDGFTLGAIAVASPLINPRGWASWFKSSNKSQTFYKTGFLMAILTTNLLCDRRDSVADILG